MPVKVEKFELPFSAAVIRQALMPNYDEHLRPSKALIRGMIWAVLAAIVFAIYIMRKGVGFNNINYLVYFLVLAVYFVTSLRSWLKAKRIYDTTIEEMEDWIRTCEEVEEYHLAFDETHITIWSDGVATEYEWKCFQKFTLDNKFVHFTIDEKGNNLFFPIDSFSDKEVYNQLVNLAKKLIPDAKRDNRILDSLVTK